MANKPVFGTMRCPHCGRLIPIIWDGNSEVSCYNCHKKFKTKRQKLKNIQEIKTLKPVSSDS